MPTGPPPSWRQYELGIADVIRHTFSQADAEVLFDTRVPGRSGRTRQVDILVSWRQPGLMRIGLVVDAKRRSRKVAVHDVDAFVGLVQDLGSDLGLLVASKGFTEGARRRAETERGIGLRIIPVEELPRWKPPGTVEVTFAVDVSDLDCAIAAFQRRDLRVDQPPHTADAAAGIVGILRHYGTRNPSADQQRDLIESGRTALEEARLSHRLVSNGVVMGGGTPSHRWITLEPIGVRVLADDPAELERQIGLVAQALGIPRSGLSAEPPPGWPS